MTRDRRERYLRDWGLGDPSEYILSERDLKQLLDEWKHDYKAWMHRDTQKKWYWKTWQGWHQNKRALACCTL